MTRHVPGNSTLRQVLAIVVCTVCAEQLNACSLRAARRDSPVPSAQADDGAAHNVLSPTETAAGWVLLFNGRTLSGWQASGEAQWQVDDGAITTAGNASGYLRTENTFEGFDLKAEFWADETMNSAIFVRCPSHGGGNVSPRTCYEVNIYDPHERYPTGSVLDVHSVLPDRPMTVGKWNSYEIILDGNRLVVKLNGKTTVDARDDRFASGTIALQANGPGSRGGTVKFRNLKIRRLPHR